MSFLEQLRHQRLALQATTTVVTTPAGERFIENKDSTVKLDRCHGFVVDTKPDHVPACILEDFLYLGSQDAVTEENVDALQLTLIVSVGIGTPPIGASNLDTVHIPCLDLPEAPLFEGVVQKAVACISRASAAHGRVLVHCNAGVSRSSSVVIAYLMQAQNMNFESAYALVKSKRPCVQPNAGFMKQLKSFKGSTVTLK